MISLNKHLVLGFAGRAGVGKNTLAAKVAHYLWGAGVIEARVPVYFGVADAIKHDIMRIFNCSLEDVNKAKTYPLGRWILEKVGTEFMSNTDMLAYLSQRISDLKDGNKVVIIHDVRKPVESSFVRDNYGGFVTFVNRPQVEDGVELKPSEKSIHNIVYDFTVLNDHGFQHLDFLAKDIANQILTHRRFKEFIKQ